MRYEARGMLVYDRENDVVAENYTSVVLVEAAKRHAQTRADALNKAERDTAEIDRLMRSNQGVL